MIKSFCVISRYKYSPRFSIDGRGYNTKKEAEKYIKLFEARTKALNKVDKDLGFNDLKPTDKIYGVAEIKVLDENKFYQD